MSESDNPIDHLARVELATESYQEKLTSGETNAEMVERFSDLERSVFEAGQNGVMGIIEGLGSLAALAGYGHQACSTGGYGEGETFFMAKSETYRNMMEAMASKPQTTPRPTDTDKRQMSGKKDKI